MIKNLSSIFKLELILLLRHSYEWLFAIAFFFIVIILFPLAFSADQVFLQKIFPGCVWIAALLAILLSIENIFLNDLEDNCLEQCWLSPFPFPLFICIKLLVHWLVCVLPLISSIPLLGLLFHIDFIELLLICLSLSLATPILIGLSCLGIALTIGLRQQGMLLGLIILPLAIPVLIFGVNITKQAHAGFAIRGPLAFLGGMSILALTFLPYLIAATLKLALED